MPFKITLHDGERAIEVDVEPQQEIMGCLLAGLIAALPGFIQAFMQCMAGAPSSAYNPGNRKRC